MNMAAVRWAAASAADTNHKPISERLSCCTLA